MGDRLGLRAVVWASRKTESRPKAGCAAMAQFRRSARAVLCRSRWREGSRPDDVIECAGCDGLCRGDMLLDGEQGTPLPVWRCPGQSWKTRMSGNACEVVGWDAVIALAYLRLQERPSSCLGQLVRTMMIWPRHGTLLEAPQVLMEFFVRCSRR